MKPPDRFWPNFAFFSLELTAIHLRAKFEVSSFNRSRDIRGSRNFNIGSPDLHMTPFDPILHFFSSELTAVNLGAKFKVSGFNRSRGISFVPKFQNWFTWLPHIPFWPNFKFIFVRTYRHPSPCQIWKLLVSTVREILGGSQNSNIVSPYPHMAPFDPILLFFR